MLTDLPPHQTAISQIPALLWELIFSDPLVKWWLHRFLLWQLTSLRAQHLADQVLADLTPHLMEISQIPVKFVFHSYSESSTFGRPGLGRSIPHQMAILQIPALLSNSYLADPLSNGDFTDSCEFDISFLLWELNIWQTRSWQMYPHLSGNFTDSYSDNSYFILTLRAYHLADQVLAYLPPHPMVNSQIPALTAHYSESSTFGRPGLVRCNPPHQMAISQIPQISFLL